MYEITMPKLSDSMEVGKIISWKVKEGDRVKEGDVLAELESDKAVMELECFHDGIIEKIVRGGDSEVPVGEVIAYVAAAGSAEAAATPAAAQAAPKRKAKAARAEAAAGPKPTPPEPAAAPAPATAAKPATTRVEEPVPPATPAVPGRERVAISPYARKLAGEYGVDYSRMQGSGPGGRIVAHDIEAARRQPATPRAGEAAAAEAVALSAAKAAPLRPSADEELPALEVTPDEAEVSEAPFRLRTQARRVTAAKHAIPHFYLTTRVDVTRLVARKEEIKQEHGATLTHLALLACIEALKQHPEALRSYDRGRVIAWKHISLGLAVQTDEGLTVPVLPRAEELDLPRLVEATRALVERARTGRLAPADMRHPNFTVSNLGMYDVEHFQPILNPPSSMVLAVASAAPGILVVGDGFRIATLMNLTLSCDHRILDGATAAAFLKDLKGRLEDADRLLRGIIKADRP